MRKTIRIVIPVRDPKSKRQYQAGEVVEVQLTTYWVRRLRDGAVVEA